MSGEPGRRGDAKDRNADRAGSVDKGCGYGALSGSLGRGLDRRWTFASLNELDLTLPGIA